MGSITSTGIGSRMSTGMGSRVKRQYNVESGFAYGMGRVPGT